jgi:Flp pilus assembly protein TadG
MLSDTSARLVVRLRRCAASLRRPLADRSGATAVELAIGILPLITILIGGVTYSGVLAAWLTMNHAASEGARAALAGLTTCERESLAVSRSQGALVFSALNANASVSAAVTTQDVQVEITLNYATNPLTPAFLPVPDTLTVRVVANTDGPEIPVSSC